MQLHAHRQATINREQKQLVGEANGLLNLAYNQLQLGLYDSVCDTMIISMQLIQTLGACRLQAYNHLNLSLAYLCLGGTVDAHRELESSKPIFQSVEDAFGDAVYYSYHGLVLEVEERPAREASLQARFRASE